MGKNDRPGFLLNRNAYIAYWAFFPSWQFLCMAALFLELGYRISLCSSHCVAQVALNSW